MITQMLGAEAEINFDVNLERWTEFEIGKNPMTQIEICLLHDLHSVWKLLKLSHLNFWILAFSTNFCPIKTDLSGSTVWPEALGFQEIVKMDHFWHF